ncbi:MAG: DUF1016 N-terminal domain-containing protein [Victivallales bacterium]
MENKREILGRPKSSTMLKSTDAGTLVSDLRKIIDETRTTVAVAVNASLTFLYWRVGKRINKEILCGRRAEYGKEILTSVSQQLVNEYGSGFSDKNIRHMMKFAESFSNEKIVSALRRQLSWTHFKAIIYIDDPLKRDFYAEMCRVENWSNCGNPTD